jgi:hypothetical protein
MAAARRSRTGTRAAIALRRLRAQRLSSARLSSPADVVGWFGAVQAQDYAGALWAIGLRLVDGRARDVERAIAERAIVRSWPMRGTLHFLNAADARWMIELLAPRALAAAAGRLRALGIDRPLLSKARRVLVKHLEGGRRLARPQVYEVFEQAGISTAEQRGLHLLWCFAHDGLVCVGPHEGKQPTFALLEEWLPGGRRLARDEALAELAHRYFAAHGPATDRDFAWWSGLPLGDARGAIAAAGRALGEETLEGDGYWLAAEGPPPAASREAAFALPPFDELMVGYEDRSAAIEPQHAGRLTPFQLLGPTVVIDGRVVATWRRRVGPKTVHFDTEPLSPLGKAKTVAVERALARYAWFFDREPRHGHR